MKYIGIALLFAASIAEGSAFKLDLDCPDSTLKYNRATRLITCNQIVVDATACEPSISATEAGHFNIYCSGKGEIKFVCPGGMNQIPSERGEPITYFCGDLKLGPPARLRIITK
jgi:hypothetical protein